jgi:hypothetical protein
MQDIPGLQHRVGLIFTLQIGYPSQNLNHPPKVQLFWLSIFSDQTSAFIRSYFFHRRRLLVGWALPNINYDWSAVPTRHIIYR